jgi:hypothetical protein
MSHRGLHRGDLADIAHWLQYGRILRVTHRNAHPRTGGSQPPHQMATDEACSAENRDQLAIHRNAPKSSLDVPGPKTTPGSHPFASSKASHAAWTSRYRKN